MAVGRHSDTASMRYMRLRGEPPADMPHDGLSQRRIGGCSKRS
ncbi:MAG: hypothetical protein OJF51_000660 [Nitrospira sp.]|nr:MAG: hypothetical protein OJF51_000660 [Nitrospira sp.]